jgi:hypothetical protein|tara:strand:- start:3984 stop:5243 length:1260 start_codon:yes stop_codon:yes gene_type:complete
MTRRTKILPKRQSQISQESIKTYKNAAKSPTPDVRRKNRGYQTSVKNDDVKQFHIGLRDIDETIVYYFNNVIKPSVIQNGKRINVPILYGSPERWAAVQKDGYYRDKNGKIQTPLIMFKRDSIEKNRNLGNKLDANNPNNFSIFQKKFSKKNVYDKFSVLNNREPVNELYGVIIPDYVNITYSCVIFTEYVEQMNKIVESINFASDAYWGDPEKFNFRAMIDNYTTVTEMNQGEDRTVKTNFDIKMMGHIVPDSINTAISNMNKFYSKSSVSFGLEIAGTEEILQASAASPASKNFKGRFYDALTGRTEVTIQSSGMTDAERTFLALTTIIDTNNQGFSINSGDNSITFNSVTIATPPANFPDLEKDDFQVFINGIITEPSAITSITQSGGNVVIDFNDDLGYTITDQMEITAVGKFEI